MPHAEHIDNNQCWYSEWPVAVYRDDREISAVDRSGVVPFTGNRRASRWITHARSADRWSAAAAAAAAAILASGDWWRQFDDVTVTSSFSVRNPRPRARAHAAGIARVRKKTETIYRKEIDWSEESRRTETTNRHTQTPREGEGERDRDRAVIRSVKLLNQLGTAVSGELTRIRRQRRDRITTRVN